MKKTYRMTGCQLLSSEMNSTPLDQSLQNAVHFAQWVAEHKPAC